jgi:hypothetical protein
MARTAPQVETARTSTIHSEMAKDETPTQPMPKAEAATPIWPRPEAKPELPKPGASTRNGSQPETVNVAASWPTVPAIDYQVWAGAGGMAVNAMLKANDALMKGMMAWSQEMSDFAQARLRENAERSESLLHCTDPTAALNVQYSFASKATEQYLEEAGKLMTMAVQVGSKCWAPIQEGTRDALGHMGDASGEHK